MSDFWDDDWDYDVNLWVQTEKTLDEFVYAIKKILGISFDKNNFTVGNINCEIINAIDFPSRFEGVPEETYSYVIRIPTCTGLIWSSIDKPFIMGLALSIQYAFKCKYLITADDDFFIAFSGSAEPLYLNTRYRPWSKELSVFSENQKKIELSLE